MPQNNNDIVNSQGYKYFIKKANLEVFNVESTNILLYSQSVLIKDCFDTIQKLEERLMEVVKSDTQLWYLSDKWK